MPPIRTTTFARGSFTRGDPASDTIRSMEAVTENFDKFVANIQELSEEIADKAGKEIIRHTTPLVPFQWGGLRQSGRSMVDKTPKGYRARVTYGGSEAPVDPTPNAPTGIVDYAVVVHEDLNKVYKEGEAKYLEKGARLAVPSIENIIRSVADKAGKGITPKK